LEEGPKGKCQAGRDCVEDDAKLGEEEEEEAVEGEE
jgi:hypothetical protein